MICQCCTESFHSIEWARDERLMEMGYIVCDDCLLYILKARMDIAKNQQAHLLSKINVLELKIKTENVNKNIDNSVKSIPNGFSDWSGNKGE